MPNGGDASQGSGGWDAPDPLPPAAPRASGLGGELEQGGVLRSGMGPGSPRSTRYNRRQRSRQGQAQGQGEGKEQGVLVGGDGRAGRAGGAGGAREGVRREREAGVSGDSQIASERRALRRAFTEALESGRGSAALRALRLLLNSGEILTEKAYSAAVFSCMRQGAWTSGLEVFRLMLEHLRSRGRGPSQASWKSLAKGLRCAGQAEQGVTVLWQALEGGVAGIDEEVCAILLDTCALKGRMGLAEEITYLMGTHNIQQGPLTFCVLLKGYGRQRRVSKVEEVMQNMRRRGVVPDVVALNAAVDAFIRCGELPKARRILSSMENAPGGSTADTWTYNTIIKGLGRELRMEEAFDVARGMLRRGCPPDEVTTNSLVDICVRCGDLDRAYGLLKDPNLTTLAQAEPRRSSSGAPSPAPPPTAVGDGNASAAGSRGNRGSSAPGSFPESDPGTAAGTGADGVSPARLGPADDAIGYDGRVRGAGIEVGDVLADERASPSAVPDVIASAPSSGSAAGSAVEIPTRVSQRRAGGDSSRGRSSRLAAGRDPGTEDRRPGGGIRPSVGAFTSILAGFAGTGDKERALGVFQQMVRAGVEPNDITYSALVSACINAGDMDGARRLLSALEATSRTKPPSSRPGVSTYNAIIGGLCRMHTEAQPVPTGDPGEAALDTVLRAIRPEGWAGAGRATSGGSEDGPGAGAEVADGAVRAAAVGSDSPDDRDDVDRSPSMPEGPGLLSAGTRDGDAASALPEGIKEALHVLLSMRRRGVQADEVTMNSILDGLVKCQPPRVREAEAILTLMSGWGIRPNQVSLSVMLNGYGREGDLGGSEVMFELMSRDADRRPDEVALNSLLDACVRNGDLRRAVQILEQAVDTALSGRATPVPSRDWVSSTGRAFWGADAGKGAVDLREAAAAEEGLLGPAGRSRRGRARNGWRAEPGEDAVGRLLDEEGEDNGDDEIVIKVRPNQVSFATVVMGLAKKGDAPAGRKAISLYELMRREFDFLPDERMVDALMIACCNAHSAWDGEDETALRRGERALQELRDIGWQDEEALEAKELMLRRVVPTMSEAWKEGGEGQPGATQKAARSPKARKRKVSAEIFEKYGWNKMESHFPIL